MTELHPLAPGDPVFERVNRRWKLYLRLEAADPPADEREAILRELRCLNSYLFPRDNFLVGR